MPLRNLARAPRRTLTTILGLAAVIVTVVSLSGMIDSFRGTVDRLEGGGLARRPSRLDVLLDGFHRRDDRTVAAIERSPAVGAAEAGIQVQESCAPPGSRSTSLSGSSMPEAASGRLPSAQARFVAAARGS